MSSPQFLLTVCVWRGVLLRHPLSPAPMYAFYESEMLDQKEGMADSRDGSLTPKEPRSS